MSIFLNSSGYSFAFKRKGKDEKVSISSNCDIRSNSSCLSFICKYFVVTTLLTT